MEIVNSYSEQNSASHQQAAFKVQSGLDNKNDEELCRNDQDFIEALEMGMAPTAGWGAGVDRLCMLFTGAQTIKEVIAFPTCRPSVLKGASKKEKKVKEE